MNYILKRKVTNTFERQEMMRSSSAFKRKEETREIGKWRNRKTILIEYVEVTNILIIDSW